MVRRYLTWAAIVGADYKRRAGDSSGPRTQHAHGAEARG